MPSILISMRVTHPWSAKLLLNTVCTLATASATARILPDSSSSSSTAEIAQQHRELDAFLAEGFAA
jgi:hypothetical protein